MKLSWATRKVLEMCGYDPDQASAYVVTEAEISLEECYYLDRAAEDLLWKLRRPGPEAR